MIINNRFEIVERLAEIIKQFEIDRNCYQTDVYLYLDDDNNGRLELYENVGGRSYIDDFHYVIYSDTEHLENASDFFETVEDFAKAIEIDVDELLRITSEHLEIDFDDVNYYDVKHCVDELYSQQIEDAYINGLDDGAYFSIATEIFEQFEDKIDRIEDYNSLMAGQSYH